MFIFVTLYGRCKNMKFGIIPNVNKDSDLSTTKEIILWLLNRNISVMLKESIAEQLKMKELSVDEEQMFLECDIVVVLGGDGTLLGVARRAALYATPLFGVNLGHMGFLTEAEISDMYMAFEKLINKQYTIEKRMMLEAYIENDSSQSEKMNALNDIGISRGPLSRIINCAIYINDHFVDMHSADGLVVSTPTGSTAYSLSAGGPIVSPSLKVIIITPICPHSLQSRSIVVSHEDTVKIELCSSDADIMMTVDGQQGYNIKMGDLITIKQSQNYTNLIKLNERNFFDVLRRKMSERRNFKI